jgi:hypothetical protein
MSGYLFEKMSSPFQDFVSSLFSRRQEAKKTGNDAMSYVYKILMNSLYGRFGINPKSEITEICNRDKYNHFLRKDEFLYGDKLGEHNYIISYWNNAPHVSDSEWNPPRVSAVQLAAAITACARIHMYPYISRSDSYYTDTDSVVLASPLADECVSDTELGKFKLEYIVFEGIFLAPKSYSLKTEGKSIFKHKGPAKSAVDAKWYESQYKDAYQNNKNPNKRNLRLVESNFNVEWSEWSIRNEMRKADLSVDDCKSTNPYDSSVFTLVTGSF